jgi:hypothetical protein
VYSWEFGRTVRRQRKHFAAASCLRGEVHVEGARKLQPHCFFIQVRNQRLRYLLVNIAASWGRRMVRIVNLRGTFPQVKATSRIRRAEPEIPFANHLSWLSLVISQLIK